MEYQFTVPVAYRPGERSAGTPGPPRSPLQGVEGGKAAHGFFPDSTQQPLRSAQLALPWPRSINCPPHTAGGVVLGNVPFLGAQEEENNPDLVEHIALSQPSACMKIKS